MAIVAISGDDRGHSGGGDRSFSGGDGSGGDGEMGRWRWVRAASAGCPAQWVRRVVLQRPNEGLTTQMVAAEQFAQVVRHCRPEVEQRAVLATLSSGASRGERGEEGEEHLYPCRPLGGAGEGR